MEALARAFGQGYEPSDGMVSLTERNVLFHQVINQIRGQQGWVTCRRLASRGIYFDVLQHCRADPQTCANRVYRVKQPLLVFLQVAIVGHWQTLQESKQ